jgi:hypothetical protein
VKCVDGVVIGADSIGTSANGVTPIRQVEANDKVKIIGQKVILAMTGPVGYGQRLQHHLDKAVNGGGFTTAAKHERAQLLCKRFIEDLQSSFAPAFPPHGLGFGALLATEISGEPSLIEFATDCAKGVKAARRRGGSAGLSPISRAKALGLGSAR